MPRTWSRWCPLDHPCGHNGAAVYQVRLLRSRRPLPIGRLLRRDPAGLLCIGMTADMQRRRRAFVQGLKRGRGHSEANLLHQLEKSTPLKRLMPRRVYQYRFRTTSNRLDAQRLEERLIKRYVKQFGEVPPLNSAIPNRYLGDGW